MAQATAANAQADAGRRRQQLSGYTIIQKNTRAWVTLRTWEWFRLYALVRPMIANAKNREDAEAAARKAQEVRAPSVPRSRAHRLRLLYCADGRGARARGEGAQGA